MKACHFNLHKQVFYFNLGFFWRFCFIQQLIFRPTSFPFCPAGLTWALEKCLLQALSIWHVYKAIPLQCAVPLSAENDKSRLAWLFFTLCCTSRCISLQCYVEFNAHAAPFHSKSDRIRRDWSVYWQRKVPGWSM